jgi:toxin FitB
VILLDTNVVSGLMQREPDPAVVAWLDDQPAESIWTTSVTVFEVQTGLALLEPGQRRRRLEEAFEQLLTEELDSRVQSFDHAAAVAAGSIAAARQRAGRMVEVRDVQIASIAAARRATLATRNVRHFDGLGVSLVNPWASN